MQVTKAKVLIVFGSSRSFGNTRLVLDELIAGCKAQFIDLSTKDISYYDYANKNADDDFLAIAKLMTESEVIVLASPVYWSAMSAQMKTFFDRFSDLLTLRKDMGRKLKGKMLYVVSTSSSAQAPQGFEVPFSDLAAYFEMFYGGHLHCKIHDTQIPADMYEKIAYFKEAVFQLACTMRLETA